MHVKHHSLSTDHPEWGPKIHELKTNDAYFAKLMSDYEILDKEICRIEENEHDTTSDADLEDMKKRRLHMTDEIISKLQ